MNRPQGSSVMASRKAVTGKPIASLSNGLFVIVETKSHSPKAAAKVTDRAGVLVKRLGKALSRPGLSRTAVFGDKPSADVFAYYVDEAKPTKIARESVTGKVTYGRMVGGKFKADKSQAD